MDQNITDFALSLPHSFMTEQWMGAHVFKVGTDADFKMFAILRPGHDRLTVKLSNPESAEMLIAADVASRNVHLPRGGWVELYLDSLEFDDVCERIKDAYGCVVGGLKRKTRDTLGL